jgi:hypothetical protein
MTLTNAMEMFAKCRRMQSQLAEMRQGFPGMYNDEDLKGALRHLNQLLYRLGDAQVTLPS